MFYNCHIHTFIDKDVPNRFLPLGLVRILATKAGFRFFSRILNSLNPFSNNDVFDRYVRFASIGRMGTQEQILNLCKSYYPKDTHFAILPMDMAFMKAGKVPRNYIDQVLELSELKKTHPEVHPFVHIDPRRPGYEDFFYQCIEELGFEGLKIYPSLGYFPYDERLYPIYEYCQKNQLPITTHCSPYNPVHYRGSKKEIKSMLKTAKIPVSTKGKSKKKLCAYFNHPKNWEIVLNDFKELKLNLAHFGSEFYWKEYLDQPGNPDNWFSIIKDMLPKYKNLYTDVTFTMNEQSFFSLLKLLLLDEEISEKVLFGSDFYMVETEATERRFGLDLRAYIGEENFYKIAKVNPDTFLANKISL